MEKSAEWYGKHVSLLGCTTCEASKGGKHAFGESIGNKEGDGSELVVIGGGVAGSKEVEDGRSCARDGVEIVFDMGEVNFLDAAIVWR